VDRVLDEGLVDNVDLQDLDWKKDLREMKRQRRIEETSPNKRNHKKTEQSPEPEKKEDHHEMG